MQVIRHDEKNEKPNRNINRKELFQKGEQKTRRWKMAMKK